MVWVAIRLKWSSGRDAQWSWTDLGDLKGPALRDAIDEHLNELRNENAWSEHYRGADYLLFPTPPQDVVDAMIADTIETIEAHQRRLADLRALQIPVGHLAPPTSDMIRAFRVALEIETPDPRKRIASEDRAADFLAKLFGRKATEYEACRLLEAHRRWKEP